jgi:hypothetical protein
MILSTQSEAHRDGASGQRPLAHGKAFSGRRESMIMNADTRSRQIADLEQIGRNIRCTPTRHTEHASATHGQRP